MTAVTLEFIAERLERIQTEQAKTRGDITEIRAAMTDMAADQTVLGQMMLRVERNIVQIKEHLGRMDTRIAHLEERAGAATPQ